MSNPEIRTITDRITLSDGSEVATTTVEPAIDGGQDGQRKGRFGEVIICHGTPWSARMWLPVARKLARHGRVRLWDMPGYGESIPDLSDTSAQPTDNPLAEAAHAVDLITQRRHLAELIDHWEVSIPHVIAHDIGGAVALGAHLLEECDFASLYLLDVVTLDPWGSPFFRIGWGEDDPWIPVEQANQLARLLPDSSGTHFPGVGHLVPVEAPSATAAELSAWLDAQPAAGCSRTAIN